MNMKENQLRVAEKIQEYIDHKQKKVTHLDVFTKEDMPEFGKWKKLRALVKHPDFEQLIPSTCINK